MTHKQIKTHVEEEGAKAPLKYKGKIFLKKMHTKIEKKNPFPIKIFKKVKNFPFILITRYVRLKAKSFIA